jgi:Exopolysaccharide biosynthesis protein
MKISKKLKDTIRFWYYMPKRLRLKNKNPTIFCSNCVGGMIYHDLRLQFRSPTVNLFMSHNDFLCFLESIDYYLHCEIEQIHEEGIAYPVGLMRRGNESVKLHFVHFRTFEEAAEKWRNRCARVDLNNAFVIMEYAPIKEDDPLWKRFCALPFDNKAVLTGDTSFDHPDLVHIGMYNEPYENGRIFAIKPGTILHRWLDDFDYVSFFNRSGK